MAKISAYTEQTDPDNDDYFIMVRAGVNYKIKRATVLEFTPTTPGDWGSPTPGSIQEALDTLAASTGSAVVADADYGDIVVSGSGTNWELDSSIDFTGKQLNNGTFDNVTVQNSILDDVVIDTTSQVDVNGLVFFVHDSGDPTKKFKFDASGIATATTRTLTVPNANGTIALTSDLSSGYQPLDSDLTSIAGLTPSNDDVIQRKAGAWTNRTMAQLATDLTATNTWQPLDSDLTTIAGLTATTDNFIQSKSSAWASRTVAQVSADLQATGLVTDAVGFRTIPQNSQSAAYTTVAADSGKHILHPSGDANARTFTIDSNANVAYPVGTAITFVNQTSQVVTIAITSDTMTLAGTTTTGSRSLAQNGVATALKITSTAWIISGTGLT